MLCCLIGFLTYGNVIDPPEIVVAVIEENQPTSISKSFKVKPVMTELPSNSGAPTTDKVHFFLHVCQFIACKKKKNFRVNGKTTATSLEKLTVRRSWNENGKDY